MKKLVTTILILIVSSLLFGAAIGESVVLYLRGYIAPRAEFYTFEDGSFDYTANVCNFSCKVQDVGSFRMLNVITL
ncbi:MAG TPA: hypothetical protein PLX62_07005 [Bacteroidales bacterium]|jgi:hypothetical protein|nr:hypothetical protein [Sphaerochaeta sp.]HQB52638.1 hypothetical protein [Bacteroidales bacterium]